MKGVRKKIIFLLIISVTPLVSCLSGLDPLPNNFEDISLSLTIPVGKAEVSLSSTYPIGDKNYRLTQQVPEWAKYESIYFRDTIPVDLSRIYQDSSTITINKLSFKINVWNEYTSPGKVNIYFANENYLPLYSLNPIDFGKGVIRYRIDKIIYNVPHYRPQAPVVFSKEDIEKLRKAEYLVFYIKIDLKDADKIQDFPFYDQCKLTCHIGASVDFVLKDI